MEISTTITKGLTKGAVQAGSFLGKVGFCILKGIKDGAKEAYKDSKTNKKGKKK